MNRKHAVPLVSFVMMLGGLCPANVWATDQVRLKNSISLDRGASTVITFTQESRFNTFTIFEDHYLSAYYLDVTYKIAPVYYSSFGFRRQDTDLATFTSHENRVYMQGGRKQRLAERLMFDTRGRIEYRSFREPILDDYFRFRIRFKLVFDAQIASVKLKPYISDELFADDREGSREFLKRSRILGGVTIPFGEHAEFEASYMLENDRDTTPLTALVTGIQIKL